MKTNIAINLPVNDLDKSKEFFTKLGFTINEQFTDETAASIGISDEIFIMLLTEEKFKSFTKKTVVDAHTNTEVINALTLESKEKVDEMFEKVIAAGGKKFRETEDHGFMYLRSFEDLDGHIWEIFWMDQSQIK